MNADQRRGYFRRWKAACIAQGWNEKDQDRRKAITLEATRQSSSTGLSNGQISRLFRLLEELAHPDSLAHAMPVANPEIGEDQDIRRQLIHVIKGFAFAPLYIEKVALGPCRAARVGIWTDLPTVELEKLRMTIKERARVRDVKAGDRPPIQRRKEPWHRRKNSLPPKEEGVSPRRTGNTVYVLDPEKKFQPASSNNPF